MLDKILTLDPSNSALFLIILGVIVFIATIAMMTVIFGTSAVLTLKKTRNLIILIVFSLTVSYFLNQISLTALFHSSAQAIK